MAFDRRVNAYTQATALTQAMLDETFRGGENDIHTVAELTKTFPSVEIATAQANGDPGVWTFAAHGLEEGQPVWFSGAPASIYYVRNPLTNSFNLSVTLHGVLTVAVGSGPVNITYEKTFTLRFSDRAKYVGHTYYQGRAKFPAIKRTVGELVSPSIQFSEMEVELNNVDGFYNRYLVSGADYFSPVGARLTVSVGLRESEGTYFEIFDGIVPEEEGFNVGRETITVRARDRAENLNIEGVLPTINLTDFPSAPQGSLGKTIPMALGNWETGYNITAATGSVSITNGGTQYDIITDSAVDFSGGLIGYNVGGGYFVFSIGSYTPDTIAAVHIKRGNTIIPVTFTAAPQATAGYWSARVFNYNIVGGGTIPYLFQDGDIAMIKVKIPYAVGKYSNPIELAEQILFTLGGLVAGDLDTASWTALKTKSTPAQSDMTSILMRVWIGKDKDKVLEYCLQHLEQVRVELYWAIGGKIALRSIHPEDFSSQGSFRFEQIYMGETSLKVTADTRNFFNKALGNYAYTPILDKTQLQTKSRKNQNSIDKSGRTVYKAIDLPGIYVESHALSQLDEFIRFYSTGLEYVSVSAAWPMLLADLTDVVMFNYKIGSVDYDNKPMKIRDITFEPSNASLTFKLLSFANFPYTGNAPANAAKMLSSQSQTIEDS